MSLFENLNSIYSIKNDIKSALENKGVDMTSYSFPDYPSVISDLSTGGNMSTLSVSENGTYYPEAGYDGFSEVSVNVFPSLGYDYIFSSNGVYDPYEYGYEGFAKIVVDVPSPQFVTESLSVSVNGTYTPGQGVDGFSQVVVDVPQSGAGFTENDVVEGNINIVNLNTNASFVAPTAFYGNSYIETVYLPNCLYLGSQRTWTTELLFFGNCSHLRAVSLPLCSTILNSAFQGCSSLSSVYIPACEYLGNSCFYGCTSLTSISLPVCEEIGSYCFGFCTSLTSISLAVCSVLYTGCFTDCYNLTEVTLASPSVCSMSITRGTIFSATPIAEGTGSIYVPASLVDAYKSARFWSQYSSQIFPISE